MHVHHTHAGTPETKGILIHWAKGYNAFFGRIIRGTDKKVIALAQLKPGNTVLDLGCGPGSLTIAAKRAVGSSGQVYGLDAAPEMIEVAQRQASNAGVEVKFQVGVIEALPFPDASVDVVLSRLVWHHLPGDLKRQAFKEIRRVLKPGGLCLIVDFEPKGMPELLAHLLTSRTPMSGVDVRTYQPLMEEAGFSEVRVGPTGHRLLSFVQGRSAS